MNNGYQADDCRILDYALWRPEGIALDLRGPAVDLTPGSYAVALGAAQTFGRFVERPYPAILAERLGVPVLNLGFSGAGPSFFLQRPELLALVNRARLAVVQVMSGRSVSNSRFVVQTNQGMVRRRDAPPGEKPRFAEHAYAELLASAPAEELVALRAEIRARAIAETSALLDRITVPRILLWFSTRDPDWQEGLSDLGAYWGAFPHFLNGGVLEALAPRAERVVRAISKAGLPQPLHDRVTGEPVEMWPAATFPHVQARHSNLYYPSSEMHQAAAAALEPAMRELLPAPRIRRPGRPARLGRRDVLVHLHIFKNAGSSLDVTLSRSFGEGFLALDPPETEAVYTEADLLRIIESRPEVLCVSSHQLRQPLFGNDRVLLHPYVLLRHPIDRLHSIYSFERLPERRAQDPSPIGNWANSLDFSGFVERCLSFDNTRGLVSNYQTRVLGSLDTPGQPRWEHVVTEAELCRALGFLEEMPAVGVVERFTESIEALRNAYAYRFACLMPVVAQENQSREAASLGQRLAGIEEQVGSVMMRRMFALNALDLVLWQAAHARLGSPRGTA